MKLFDLFGKKEKKTQGQRQETKSEEMKNETTKENASTQNSEATQNNATLNQSKPNEKEQDSLTESFVFGVQDTFKLLNSEDLVVVGRVKGTVRPGMAVYVSNFGDDEGGVLLTTVLGLEIDQNTVDVATDCHVALKLEAGQKSNIKIGTIVHTRDSSIKDVHDAYIAAIGDSYVIRKDFTFTDEELACMSITDCEEAWRLFQWIQSQNENRTEEQKQIYRSKVDRLAAVLCKKILGAEEIYVVYSKRTGEPHMFSHTVSQDGGYMCTPPDILIISKAYVKAFEKMYTTDRFEVRKIENGEKKDGIYNFLGSTFYLNGACGVAIISEQTSISASMLVQKPDYSGIPPINVPVTNPDVMRWMLLIGQLGKPGTPDEELIYKLYYGFLSKEIPKAMFVIPMKTEGEIPEADADGKTVLKEDVSLNFPTMEGKYEKQAIRMFTDWKRLQMEFGPDWSGFLQPISGMIDTFDCAINATKYPEAGCYISKEMYEEMTKTSEKDKQE